MAPGTGKTFTTCFCVEKLFLNENPLVIIAVPYIHLIEQRKESITQIIDDVEIIKVCSENHSWKEDLREHIKHKKILKTKKIIVITTIASWHTNTFSSLEKLWGGNILLIVDEAHRISSSVNKIDSNKYIYKIGLSATPLKGKEVDTDLLHFFGGPVYNLPIEKALNDGFLCSYDYHPIFVKTTEADEIEFKKVMRKIANCYDKNGAVIHGKEQILSSYVRLKYRILALAENKRDREKIVEVIKKCNLNNHFIFYCGNGRMFDNDETHLNYVKNILDDMGFRMNRFTCSENMNERIEIINIFNENIIDGLGK